MTRLERCHSGLTLSLSLLCLTTITTPCYGIELCAQGHTFLVSNRTNGSTLTYINTHTQEPNYVTFEDHYLPPSTVCGERNGRCGISSVFNSNGSILAVVIPFGDGVGLVSYQSNNASLIFREMLFLPYNLGNCVPAYFPPFADSLEPFYGYCLDLSNHMIENIVVSVVFERLNSSYVQSAINFLPFDFQSNSRLSNFVHFPEIGSDICFSIEKGHTTFLRNSDIVDHSIAIREFDSDFGNIGVPACSTSEPRMQRLEGECMLAAYCNGTTALFGAPEMFSGVTRFSKEIYGDVFLCSSAHYVRFMNNSLSVHNVNDGEQISSSVPFDAETILLGDCLVSGGLFYFVAANTDARTVFIHFTNLSTHLLGENTNPLLVPYTIADELLFVNNRTHSLVYNWTRMCPEDVVVISTNFDLVHSFIDQSLTEECGCVQDSTTTAAPINTTTTNQIEPTTFATSTMESISVTTERPITSLSPSSSLSAEEIAATAVGVILAVALIIYFIILIILVVCLLVSRNSRSRPLTDRESGQRDEKRELIRLTKLNNNVEESNNVEHNEQPPVQPVEQGPPPSPPIGIEESLTDREPTVLVPTPQRNLSSVVNTTNQSESSLDESKVYPINTVPESQGTPPDLRRNDSQLVTGSTPPNNGGFLAQVSMDDNLGTASTNSNGDVDPSPSSCTASPNHVLVPNDNRGAEVNTVPEDVTDNRQDACDLVTSERRPAVMPSRQSVADHMCQCEASFAQRYNNNHQLDVSNLPNGLVGPMPNNNATLSQ